MSKTHVLPDESLGGVLREYIEVGRIPKDNDLIINYGNNRIYKTTVFAGSPAFYDVETNEKYTGWADINGKLHYKTLEPTDIVHIDGVRYRLIDRKAKVGEKVLDLFDKKTPVKEIVKEFRGSVWYEYQDEEGTDIAPIQTHEYRILEPIEPTELVTAEEGDEKSILDLLANLARRVTELERKLEREQEFRESLYRKISDMKDDIEMALDDIITLDERTQPLVALVKAVRGDE
jgi:hypothetical protein